MVFTLSNMWLGNEDSLQDVINLNTQIKSPTQDAKAWLFDDDDEDDKYPGIGSRLIQVEGSVGIVQVNGSLTNLYHAWNRHFGVISYDEIRDALVSLANDEEISSIMLAIDTGGGSAHGVSELAELIRQIDTEIKPIEAHTSMYVFSAGMWLASATRKISAAQVSEQGSIGVIITLTSYAEMYRKAGIEQKYIRAGKYKALGQASEEISDQVIAIAEEKADKLYGYFLDAMIKGRPNLSIGNKDVWAEGKTFFADQAIGIGLIDEILSFDKVVAKLSSNYDNGGRNAQLSNQSLQEGVEMANGRKGRKAVLSEQNLAALAAGAEVETETNLEEEEVVEEETTETEEGSDETTDTGEETSDESEASAKTEASTLNLGAELKALMKDNVKLELKLEAALEATETVKASLQATLDLLKPIAMQAVSNLQIAVGQTPVDLSSVSVESLAEMHTKATEAFNAQYSRGGPKSRVNAEARSEANNVTTEYCPIYKPEK